LESRREWEKGQGPHEEYGENFTKKPGGGPYRLFGQSNKEQRGLLEFRGKRVKERTKLTVLSSGKELLKNPRGVSPKGEKLQGWKKENGRQGREYKEEVSKMLV